MDETPKAFRAKRRMQVSLSVLPDPNSPAVDSDVDVFPSAIKVKKPKATSLEVAKKVASNFQYCHHSIFS